MPLVSVIIPIYNIEKCLPYCIESVIAQKHKNLEIILVDDESPDSCGKICDDYAKKDGRIKVIHRQNGGLSAARNSGIEIAKGDYIMFLDGDDIISPDSIELLLRPFIEYQEVILSVHSYCRIRDYNYSFKNPSQSFNEWDSESVIKGILTGDFTEISAWGKLYPKHLIGKLRFSEGRTHFEDKYFLFKYFLKNNGKAVLFDDQLYGYYVREGSITNSTYSKSDLNILYFYRQMLLLTRKYRPEYLSLAEYNDVIGRLMVLKSIIRSKGYKEHYRTFNKVKMKLLKTYRNRPVSFFGKYKYEILTLRISDHLYILCVDWFDRIRENIKLGMS